MRSNHRLDGLYASKHYPTYMRRIRFRDPRLDKTLVFLTNNTALSPLTVAALYKGRWEVELFSTWINTASPNQEVSGHERKCRKDSDLV